MIPIEWWTSTAIDDALGCYVWQAATQGPVSERPEQTLARVLAMCEAMPAAARSAVVEAAMADPWWRAQALELAARLCLERDEEAANAPPPRTHGVALVNGAIGSAIAGVRAMTWEQMIPMLTEPIRWAGEKVRAPAWLPVVMRPDAPPVRRDEHVEAVSCIVLDIDENADLPAVIATVRGLATRAVLHTTWSHTLEKHKARVVLPLREDCPRDRWGEVWRCADQWARSWGATIDPQCKNPSRLYFLPALPADEWRERRGWYRAEVFSGEAMHWRWLLAHHQPPAPIAPPPIPVARSWGGINGRTLDRTDKRRRAFALGVLRRACEDMGAEGSRNKGCFRGGAAVARLALAGVMGEDEGKSTILAAAMGAGLDQQEAETAYANGHRAGKMEGPWDFSTL